MKRFLDSLQRAFQQAGELWEKVPTAVKWSLLGGAIFIPLYFALVSPLGTKSEVNLVPLPGQPFTSTDANAVVAKLNEQNVAYKLGGPDGSTILVAPADQMKARMAVAQAGVPQQPAGFELFDRNNMTQTDFDRKVQLLRALQGELSRVIGGLAGIKSAAVQLSIPEKSVFIREQKPVKAAVMVEPRPGVELSAKEVEGVVRFVAASVPELDPDQVTVIDNTGRMLAQGLARLLGGQQQLTEASDQLKQQLAYQKNLESGLQGMLDRAFGAGNASVMVNVRLSFESRQEERTTFTGPGADGKGLARSEQVSEKTFEGQGQGADANTPSPPIYQGAPGAAGGGQSSFGEKSRTTNYEIDQTKVVQVTPPGSVVGISVGVFLNQQILQGTNVAQIQETVAKAAGAKPEDVTVAPLVFSNELVNLFKPEEKEPATAQPAVNWQYVAIGLAGLAVVLLVLAAVSWRRRMQPGLEPIAAMAGTAMDLEQLAAAQEEGVSTSGMKAEAAAEVVEPPMPLVTEQDLMRALGQEFKQPAQLDPVREKLREEIGKLIHHNPDVVVQLVKAWIGEDSDE